MACAKNKPSHCFFCGAEINVSDPRGRKVASYRRSAQRWACLPCGSSIGVRTLEEYRFQTGLREGVLPYVFAGEAVPPGQQRDCIAVVSRGRPLMHLVAHNFGMRRKNSNVLPMVETSGERDIAP
jgi:hypothetical protein